MSFNWSEYLTLAQELASRSAISPIQEANLRAAISRAYYSAFCRVRNHLLYRDRTLVLRRGAHIFVADTFENSTDKKRQTIGFLLHDLRSIRHIADYEDMFYGDKPGRTQAALVEAEEILHLLDTL